MGDIKHLPEAVRSSVRSGIILFDLARVVEELIFNSLDAGATKVSVAVSAGICYVKVVDNGCGITRDGLVLLGERYATSKFDQLAETDAVSGSFGFRGEALSSISDVSLLEVITKAHGRPNGYRKVMKGCKCLYLGIDDGRQDMGTTVIVRDLFYNQPVRRKHIQSSTKKVLQLVKKCVLRISLVHPKVLFKVLDIESDDELFCTAPSSSPLSLLMSSFGIEVSSSLQELSVSDGVLNLLGYMSSPLDSSFVKPFQYVYINSRYICKGPVHKLLNQLATRVNSLDPQKAYIAQNAKRSRSQTYATYILNLRCPRSWYDLTFEPSKTSVEFKDWLPIIGFIEKAITSFWSEKFSYDLCCTADTSEKYIMQREADNALSPEEEKSNEHTDYTLDSGLDDEHVNVDANMSNVYTGNAISCERFKIGDDMGKDLKKPFLQHCSTWGSLPLDGEASVSSEGFDFETYGFRTKRKRLETDDLVDGGVVDDSDQRFDFLRRTQWQDEAATAQFSPRAMAERDTLTSLNFWARDSIKSSAVGGECLAREYDLLIDSVAHIRQFGSTHQHLDSEWSPVMSDPLFGGKSQRVEQLINEKALERCIKYDTSARYDHMEDRKSKDNVFHFDDTIQNSSSLENCSFSSWKNKYLDSKTSARSQDNGSGFLPQHNLDDVLFPKCADIYSEEPEWLFLDSPVKHNGNYCAATSCHIPSPIYRDKDENQKDYVVYQEVDYVCKKRPRRCHSAPPFYRGKKKLFVSNDNLAMEAGRPKIHAIGDAPTPQETGELKHSQRSAGVYQLHSESNSIEDRAVYTRPDKKQAPDLIDLQNLVLEKKTGELQICCKDSGEDIQHPSDSWLKWRKSCPRTANGDKLLSVRNEDTILDVSSGILHLAGDSLVPESITKSCLEDAIVLQQVDKKFIPVVGSGVLAIIDQHAADERIRLEELRQKVLSGEKKKLTYLDTEQKLVLPEIEYQLLHNYAEQIQSWGWLCNIHAPTSKSFKKNLNLLNKQPTAVTLLAVPCILGVNLTDVDLLEFLQQLADTDGSSAIPPSVHRVLNFKACRGAIMFGDTLLPSECSLIVEELKQTSLCFQCAHGRPTTVPLVNLEALHKQIVKLGSWNEGSNGLWHGLRRHKLSLERAAHRLSSARGEC